MFSVLSYLQINGVFSRTAMTNVFIIKSVCLFWVRKEDSQSQPLLTTDFVQVLPALLVFQLVLETSNFPDFQQNINWPKPSQMAFHSLSCAPSFSSPNKKPGLWMSVYRATGNFNIFYVFNARFFWPQLLQMSQVSNMFTGASCRLGNTTCLVCFPLHKIGVWNSTNGGGLSCRIESD